MVPLRCAFTSHRTNLAHRNFFLRVANAYNNYSVLLCDVKQLSKELKRSRSTIRLASISIGCPLSIVSYECLNSRPYNGTSKCACVGEYPCSLRHWIQRTVGCPFPGIARSHCGLVHKSRRWQNVQSSALKQSLELARAVDTA